jgi:hypothetical protein
MATTLVFTDGIGAATLKNSKVVPGDRFSSWVTVSKPIGESANRQSDLALSMFKLADSYGATFDLTQIPVAAQSGVRLVDVAARLVYWLLSGGVVAVNTGDVDSNAYASCGLMPGTTPTLTLSDRKNLEYTLSLALVNLAGSPVPMVCHYAT